ncbi:uncharacterized protein LOC128672526 isoform X2 [Plodia interpunctella]|uniref:uncharacterized protein LOC128672526 isoform X2 n=1 Tax=Plodia interpunctella TaxID=58824 RepID=UPI002367B43C|nr:uncharacterized protein LOC128672526 isoform X2 [Plodia interpunctella]
MSGCPPPPYFGHHPPQATPMQPGVTYVPTPVYVPMYPQPPPPQPTPPNATYVTNVYQHPPVVAEPIVQLREDPIDWIPASSLNARSLEYKAFVGGKEGWDGSPLWVIRARHNNEYVPGKLAIKHRSAYIPYGGQEVQVQNFEVLCTTPGAVRWLPGSNGQVPVEAIAAGNTVSGEPLYIAKVRHRGSITPGKVHPSHGCCYISFGGMEIPYKTYEVLCKVVG